MQTDQTNANHRFLVPCIYSLLQPQKKEEPLKVQVPGSKSITNRALLLSTLAQGTSTLDGVLFSDDSRHFLSCIQQLGFQTSVDEKNRRITVCGLGGAVPKKEASLYVGSAGTAARFLTAYLGLSRGIFHMDASPQMRRRPMAPLLDSLQTLGCEIDYPADGATGYFPFTLHGHGCHAEEITIDINHSSQFLSALLIASCITEKDFTIHIEGSHGMAYIEMTNRMMQQFGVLSQRIDERTVLIPAGQTYRSREYRIEPDASAAAYFYAMSPLLGIPVLVEGVHFDSLQGDVAFIRILEQMGCKAQETDDGVLLSPPESKDYSGITVDMSACSDQAITLAAIAPFADSPTTIQGIGHIRFQECDRLNAIVTELRKMGITCEETTDSITIYPGSPKASLVETYEDHRMAMGFSLIGLKSPGIVIDHPECCRKTFENYFDVLTAVITRLTGA